MSYVDRNPGNNQKAFTGVLVALIQGGLVLALINGFAVTIFEREAPPRLEGEQIRLEPLPPEPVPKPVAEPERVIMPRPAPKPNLVLESNKPVDVTPALPTGPIDEFAFKGDLVLPSVKPMQNPPRFTPMGARPSNDAASWVTTDDYPTRELRAGHQGAVRFELAIDARGRVSQCTIVASSGYAGLDAATCRYVARRARFAPATNGDGGNVAGSYSGTIRWVIPRD